MTRVALKKIPPSEKPGKSLTRANGSFRDPQGVVYLGESSVWRWENPDLALTPEHIDFLRALTAKQLLLPAERFEHDGEHWWRAETLRPWIYPYEWPLVQLWEAAKFTLQLNHEALQAGWILKDATPFNIQFVGTAPQLIDHFSFERYEPGKPWVAYEQFCREFLGPLFLARYLGESVRSRLGFAPQGLPLDFVSRVLPWKSYLSLSCCLHIHLQAYLGKKSAATPTQGKQVELSREGLERVLQSLDTALQACRVDVASSAWSDYYEKLPSYSPAEFAEKSQVFTRLLALASNGEGAIDLGCNTGYFSVLLSKKYSYVVAADQDSESLSKLHLSLRQNGVRNVSPFVLNLLAPTPALGFAGKERSSFADRVKPSLATALALIHHVCISGGIPLEEFLAWLASFAPEVILEWVAPEDKMAAQLLRTNPAAAQRYTSEAFEQALARYFRVVEVCPLQGTSRRMYLLRRLGS